MSTQDEPSAQPMAVESGKPGQTLAADAAASELTEGQDSQPLIIGWREWVSLPQLGLPAIKAKIDTGARSSAIHAFDIQRTQRNGGQDWLQFKVQPVQRNSSIVRHCEAQLVDIRRVTDSGGHAAERFFITTELQLGPILRTIEVTLFQRDDMLFRMLLGRTAMVPGIQVDPSKSFSFGRLPARQLYAEDSAGARS